MKSHWRKLAALLPREIEKKIYHSYFQSKHKEWLNSNDPHLSHLTKQELLKRYASQQKLKVLVETGTYMGDMVFAMQDQFDHIYSIELSPLFFQKAKRRFRSYKQVTILEGDSGKVLKELLPGITKPALFWLDGHYSGGLTAKGDRECPIYEELTNILSSRVDHTVLIDDARLFIGQNDYPTIPELKEFILRLKPTCSFTFENDVIIITSN